MDTMGRCEFLDNLEAQATVISASASFEYQYLEFYGYVEGDIFYNWGYIFQYDTKTGELYLNCLSRYSHSLWRGNLEDMPPFVKHRFTLMWAKYAADMYS